MQRKKLKIVPCQTRGAGLSPFFLQCLSRRYDVEVVKRIEGEPDLFFYSAREFRAEKKGTPDHFRVFITGENIKPDFRFFDYAFSFEETDDKNFCYPHFVSRPLFSELRSGRYSNELKEYRAHPKSRFCSFVYSDSSGPRGMGGKRIRMEFCKKLMSYKRVDCPGYALHNMPAIGPSIEDKLDFIKQHKFSIEFENIKTPNYVSEKIFQALLVNSIPIYWGCPRIAEYFNPEAFINCHDYDSFDRVIDRVIEVDNNDDLYQKYVNAPPILEGSKAHAVTEEAILERMDEIVNSIGVVAPVSSKISYKLRRPFYRFGYYLAEKIQQCSYHLGCWVRVRLNPLPPPNSRIYGRKFWR